MLHASGRLYTVQNSLTGGKQVEVVLGILGEIRELCD